MLSLTQTVCLLLASQEILYEQALLVFPPLWPDSAPFYSIGATPVDVMVPDLSTLPLL